MYNKIIYIYIVHIYIKLKNEMWLFWSQTGSICAYFFCCKMMTSRLSHPSRKTNLDAHTIDQQINILIHYSWKLILSIYYILLCNCICKYRGQKMSNLWPYLGFQHPFTSYFRVHQGQNRTLGTSSKCAAPWREHRKTRSGSWSKTWARNTGCQRVDFDVDWMGLDVDFMVVLWELMADLWQTYGIVWQAWKILWWFYGEQNRDLMDLTVVICGNKLWGVRQVFVGYNNDVSNSINNVNDTTGDEIRLQHDVPSTSNFHTSWAS
jgi:hypothetical protein